MLKRDLAKHAKFKHHVLPGHLTLMGRGQKLLLTTHAPSKTSCDYT